MNRTIDLRNRAPTDYAITSGSAGGAGSVQQPLDPHAVAFITCVSDEKQYNICLRYFDALPIPSGYTVERIAVFGATSMAEGYQRAMQSSRARYKLYVHQDTYVVHRGLLPELLNLFGTYPRLGIVGVLGATLLPDSGKPLVGNRFHRYGRVWEYWRQGGLYYLLGRANRRRVYLTCLRSFVGDYLPAVALDGLFLATQYDVPWVDPLGGFMLYDQVQALEFIKHGFEVGIARQEAVWCNHWGPPQERSREQHRRRRIEFRRADAVFRKLYQSFCGVPARRLYRQQQKIPWRLGLTAGEFSNGVTDRQVVPKDSKPPDHARDRLGIIVVALSGGESLVKALHALLLQCDELNDIDCQVVVVDNVPASGTVEAVCRAFPQVTVMTRPPNGGAARASNIGLRCLNFPCYILIMHDDVEFCTGTLARMVSHLRTHPSTAGVVGFLTNPDGTIQRPQRTTFVPWPKRDLGGRSWFTFVGTTCALVRGDVFLDVGLYDERFRFCREDLNWSLRAKRKDYKFALLPKARVIHYQRDESRKHQPTVLAESLVANLWLWYKHRGRRLASALYPAQQLLGWWLMFRWRNDSEALYKLNEATARENGLYRQFRGENRLPQLLEPE